MLSVAIFINGNPVMARSCVRHQSASGDNQELEYLVDDGSTVDHNPNDGAVILAIKLLETIKEQR